MHVEVQHRLMQFKQASGTSRGILKTKDSWFLKLSDDAAQSGIGECSTITGLSPDIDNGLVTTLELLAKTNQLDSLSTEPDNLDRLPALNFALEMAKLDLASTTPFELFPSGFLSGKGIPINGLVWMGSKAFMYEQIKAKIEGGYNCIKIKIAAIAFEEELSLLSYIRSQFSEEDIEIRVDANGGFSVEEAREKLSRLSAYKLHSIEQPIATGQLDQMASLCEASPLDIALDEELIGITGFSAKKKLLDHIRPQYIILKPSLLGGFAKAEEWITAAEQRNIGWWATSALEANVGLSAIAQWTATLHTKMHQGLGTGQLFSNNIASPLYIDSGKLYYGDSPWETIFS